MYNEILASLEPILFVFGNIFSIFKEKMNTKICSNCKTLKPLEDYQKGTGKYQKRAQCKLCCKLLYDTPERLAKNKIKRALKRKENPEYRERERFLAKKGNHDNPIRYLLRSAKSRAKSRNLEFNITEKDLILPEFCPLLNLPLQTNNEKKQHNSYSIDRIDSTKGYVPGNVWIISTRANILKNNSTIKELELLVTNLKKYWKH